MLCNMRTHNTQTEITMSMSSDEMEKQRDDLWNELKSTLQKTCLSIR